MPKRLLTTPTPNPPPNWPKVLTWLLIESTVARTSAAICWLSQALVIGCAGDDLHPVAVAEQLAAALPHATLHVYDRPGVLWTERADLRERISTFLNG